ncbi:DUF2608 domain-containing protein [Pseudoalteromonas sp. Cnat2-41]|uniref:DUF2608 domain-containing protein n=1 Tax=unclassified Pseudoalteromonas TaxID=194690 RepID=UPI001EF7D424|nr:MULTISPECIES: DUF2608 domain-containing protein [unclassified Pseudoalteromonas]MCF2862130.1 DUF2608 domain-containing protein [Pseudoalteromonas sp. CNAT2-18]MCG7558101.1 DUF2608 domain-containing protein [Pseudoalteromonas sp. CNAT2-18.1]
MHFLSLIYYALLTGIAAMTLSTHVYAESAKSILTTDSFVTLEQQVMQWGEPENTLVVMDNDDTLTMIACADDQSPSKCQYLGGAAWYAWQSELVTAQSAPRVADTSLELIEASDLLFALNTMVYTRDNVPAILARLSSQGVRLMVETARGNQTISATEDQFTDLTLPDGGDLLGFFATHAPKFAGLASKASPYSSCDSGSKRRISYRQGVMYLAGQDKGKNLLCFVNQYNDTLSPDKQIRNIAFIDDTLENVESINHAFATQAQFNVAAYHYTALAAHKAALTQGPMAKKHQAKATERWCKVIKTMTKELIKPSYTRECR